MARYATRQVLQAIEQSELRFVMIEGAPRILPEVTERWRATHSSS